MIAETVTLPRPSTPTSLLLPLKTRTDDALERLVTIIETVGIEMCEKYRDKLSYALVDWAYKVIYIDEDKPEQTDDELENEIERSLKKLKTILIDFFVNIPLRDPVLVVETGWTCEKALIEACHLQYKKKPITIIPHTLALNIMEWASSISEDPTLKAKQIILFNPESNNETMQCFISTYKILASQTMLRFRMGAFIKEMQEDKEKFECLVELIKVESAKSLQQVEQENLERQKQLEMRLEAVEKASRENQMKREALLRENNEKIEACIEEIRKLQNQNIAYEQEIAALHNALAAARQRVDSLKKPKKKKCIVQ